MVRRILITGANKGIGLAIAKRCVADHDDVEVILACRSKARGDAAAASLASPRVSVVELDSTSEASVAAAAAEVAKRHGATPLYGVVNNAGIAAGTVAEILETNVRGPIRVDAAFLPLLGQAPGPGEGRALRGVRCTHASITTASPPGPCPGPSARGRARP